MKPLKDIPNSIGFVFTGITKDGKKLNCIVEQDEETGLHYIVETRTLEKCYDSLVGWIVKR